MASILQGTSAAATAGEVIIFDGRNGPKFRGASMQIGLWCTSHCPRHCDDVEMKRQILLFVMEARALVALEKSIY